MGLMLIVGGLAAMATGWDQILIERGWSLFISGATLVAGGSITISLAAVIGRLDALARSALVLPKKTVEPMQPSAPRARDERAGDAPPPPLNATAVQSAPSQAPAPPPEPLATPTVIDRYEAGGASYAMYSDGSVEVETEFGVQRYASLAELRNNIET
jgi:hypothetical protein